MENFVLTMLYESLMSVTIALIGIIIPFTGAYWIYKRTIKSNAELQIFKIGREISEVLHGATEIRLPFGLTSYTYIDNNLHRVEEQNRNIAIHELQKIIMRSFNFPKDSDDLDDTEKANIIFAITADRFESLVPQGIKWSGKGPFASLFGEKITIDNQLFPFGTKLYRQWIEQFSYIYNDIWMCTHAFNRKKLIKEFTKNKGKSEVSTISEWLDNIEKTIRDIRYLHSRLITQVQIIDNNVDERTFSRNLLVCAFYIIMMSIAGYFIPRILLESKEVTLINFALLLGASLALYSLAVYRLLAYSRHPSDTDEQRKIFLPPLLKSLNEMKGNSLKYKYTFVENIISLQDDLRLPNSLIALLVNCVEELKNYNEYARVFTTQISGLIDEMMKSYATETEGSSFKVLLQDIPNEDFDMDVIYRRINDENMTFSIDYNEQHMSRTLYSVNLTALNKKQRSDLCEVIKKIRAVSSNLPSYKSLKYSQKRINNLIELIEKKLKMNLLN